MARVSNPMMPPPITSTVASFGMRTISRPDRQHAAGSVSAAVTGDRPSGIACTAWVGRATRSAKPPARVRRGQWLTRPTWHSGHSPQP
jgi:hypothetical protein